MITTNHRARKLFLHPGSLARMRTLQGSVGGMALLVRHHRCHFDSVITFAVGALSAPTIVYRYVFIFRTMSTNSCARKSHVVQDCFMLCVQKKQVLFPVCAKETRSVSCVCKRNTFCFLCAQKKHVLFPVCAKETRSVSCASRFKLMGNLISISDQSLCL